MLRISAIWQVPVECGGEILTQTIDSVDFPPHNEDLVEGLDGQAIQLFTFWLWYNLAVLLFDRGDLGPTFYRYLPYGITIVGRRQEADPTKWDVVIAG
jgi:hypothetical protein